MFYRTIIICGLVEKVSLKAHIYKINVVLFLEHVKNYVAVYSYEHSIPKNI